MAQRLSRNAPYEIASIDIHSINDVFRQIQQAVDELRGLQGAVTIYSPVTYDTTVTFNDDQYATTAEIADVASTESAGTSDTIARGDHVHKGDHGSLAGLSDDDHSLYPLVTNFEADRATLATNWEDLTDGGDTTLHTHTGSTEQKTPPFVDGDETSPIWERVLAGSNITITEVANGEAISIASTGGGMTQQEVEAIADFRI